MTSLPEAQQSAPKKSACILCSINCGIEVHTGGKDGRELIKIKGDRDHPSSQGYVCNKAARLNHYQMGTDRLDVPMRRKPDGSYEPVDWNTAIREVAAGLARVQQTHGGDKIYYIGGGGQGNHLGGMYGRGLIGLLGVKYQTNALAQEKTGEFWVSGKMFGGGPHGDFHHTEVAVFVGKNPWQSHGFPQARKVLNEIARDPERSMIVLDPCLTDTAKKADFHLRVKPGSDAWCLSAMIATVVQEDLFDHDFVAQHTAGWDEIREHFEQLDIADFAATCEVEEELIRAAARRIATASSAAVFEDLGTQQNVHSTVVSYLQRILWVITGNFAKKGGHNIPVAFLSVTDAAKQGVGGERKRPANRSPVLGSRVITGLLPCNEVPDEILTDHPDRFRAAIIQSSNPVHAYADTPRMKEAIETLEFSVVIDVAMTETARCASYVLPASSQFEKHECTFFSVEFPRNHFHLRQPVVEPLPGTLPESEIHTRLIEELGGLDQNVVDQLRAALEVGRQPFAATFAQLLGQNPALFKVAPSLLYRTLGPTLKGGDAAEAAVFWPLCHQFVQRNGEYAAHAGFDGDTWSAGEQMFETLISNPSGFVYTDSPDYADSWKRMGVAGGRIRLHLDELFPQVVDLDPEPLEMQKEFPFVLAAGNRRGTTSNTIIRDSSWEKKGMLGTLYMHPKDAESLGAATGDAIRITTPRGSAETVLEVDEIQRPGSVALPNGVGLDVPDADGGFRRVGIAPNDLTSSHRKDFFAGTPWHKNVPARVERI